MCILFTYANANPLCGGYKLIVASNRDELYARPAIPAAKWEEDPRILGGKQRAVTFKEYIFEFIYEGRDMEPGRELGSWLAIGNHNGTVKVGALLNIVGEPCLPNALHRGPLISDYLNSGLPAKEFADQLIPTSKQYSSFMLVAIEIR